MSSRFPKKINELPSEPYLAILQEDHVYVPGDERSRTNPGHGYEEHTVDAWSMMVFQDETAWKQEIEQLTKRRVKFQAVRIVPAKVETKVVIT